MTEQKPRRHFHDELDTLTRHGRPLPLVRCHAVVASDVPLEDIPQSVPDQPSKHLDSSVLLKTAFIGAPGRS